MRGNVPDDDGPVKGAGDDAAGALVGHRLGREGHARQVGRVVAELLVLRAREVLYICIYIYIYIHILKLTFAFHSQSFVDLACVELLAQWLRKTFCSRCRYGLWQRTSGSNTA